MATLLDLFPALGVTITNGPVTLRVPRPDELPALIDVAIEGIQDPDEPTPFLIDWHLLPPAELAPNSGAFILSTLATMKPEAFTLYFGVWHEDVLVGAQDMTATDFRRTRSAETGSWLGKKHQGQGIGTLMRQAILTLAFDHLDAVEMTSMYNPDNPRSARVSQKCGYVPNGVRLMAKGDSAVLEQAVRVTPDTFIRPRTDVVITGAEVLRRHLGIARESDEPAPTSADAT